MASERFQRWTQAGALFALGFFALAAQTLLFRSFLTAFEGHEFALGLFFSSWLIWLAVGALAGRVRVAWLDAWASRLDLLLLLYLPAFLLQESLLLHARSLTGVASYELFPWLPMLGIASLANAPVSCVTGFLFTLACRQPANQNGLPVARVYILESLGSAAGGAAVTVWLALGWAEESAFLFCAVLLLVMAALRRTQIWRILFLLAGVLLLAAVWLGYGNEWTRTQDVTRWTRLLPAKSFRGAFATPQARYLYGNERGQFIVTCGGDVVETFPNDEPASLRIALLLAQQPQARRILLIGPDSLAIARRLLLLPQIEQVVWLHPDPAYPAQVLAALPVAQRPDVRRFNAPAEEVRAYLQRHAETFDAALLNLPDATTLVANRYLTDEFFRRLQTRLAPAGVVGVRLAGGENFLGSELVHLGASLYTTLQGVFPRLALAPGDESWLFASRTAPLSEDALDLGARWHLVPEAAHLYPVEGIYAAMPADRIQFQRRAYQEAIERLTGPSVAPQREGENALRNTDNRPLALLFNLLLLGKAYGWALPAQFLSDVARNWLAPAVLLTLLLYAILRVVYVWRTPRRTLIASASSPRRLDQFMLLFSTGLLGMAASLLLMALYQLRFGALFLHVGLISALFMLGLTVGGRLGTILGERWPAIVRWGLFLTLLLQVGLLFNVAIHTEDFTVGAFWTLFFVIGCFQGVYVPLAAAQLKGSGASDVASGAAVESLDNVGGAVGGLLAGVVLLPVLGVSGTVLLLMGFVAVNLVAVIPWPAAWPQPESGDAVDRWSRRLGYLLAGVLLWLLMTGWYARQLQEAHARQVAQDTPELMDLARELMPDAAVEQNTITAPDASVRTYLRLQTTNAVYYLIHSDALTPQVGGYGGPLRLALLLREDGTLVDFRMVRHYETPSYLRRIKRWLETLKGRNITQPEPLAKVDGVSGATYTSYAVLQTLRQAGPVFAEKVLHQEVERQASMAGRILRIQGVAFGLILLLPLLLRRMPRRALLWVRLGWLALVLGFLGFHLNIQFSLHEVLSLARGECPPAAWSAPFLRTMVVPLLVLLLGNYYCGWLCPFGAAQELAALLCPPRWRLDPRKTIWRWTRCLKYILLAAAVIALICGWSDRAQRADPLVTCFSGFADRPVLSYAVALLLAAVFFGRFWCRNLCPAGAFLGWLGGWRPLRRLMPPIAPGCCDYGVRHARDLDCLQCDRCRRAGAKPLPETSASHLSPREMLFLVAVVAATIFLVRLAVLTPAEIPGPGKGSAAAIQVQGKPAPTPKELARKAAMSPEELERMRELVRQKKLSDHEAKYYKTLKEP